ncbi:MAG: TlpA family protein disulfide reductase [Pseudomonadales bacterium]|jgi:peroxiredoxin|nr:TlpA family protein disulfide reductase [Pseudomonadales bacterium]MDP4639340.1 TlpA family protein disulfide reductase [Pseudomonadales bacterium]MDP4765968.1 TlpA family protein disulfide reductase [Pseudomonadales bacterium]MDP4874988.1 TlpA family protein disulfide reductase [Pseudomonadales bacterium]MDP4912485.1 TlpA family protein disulfide reductase [Pseudomonadales bacterium]
MANQHLTNKQSQHGARLLCAALCTAVLALPAMADAIPVFGAAPDFTLPRAAGGNLRLAEQRGDVIMLNFWASWCGPCRQELPALAELHNRFGPAGFKVLGINVDAQPEKAQRILQELNLPFPILYDSAGAVSATYRVNAMPSTVIIDRDGQMRYLHEGYKAGYADLYRSEITELLGE